MTGKEMEKLRNSLPKWENGKPPILTAEQEQLDRELWCREMINSILIYHGKNNIMDNDYLEKYIDELGIKLVKKLVGRKIRNLLENILIIILLKSF